MANHSISLISHYNQLWEQSLRKFAQGKFAYDPWIDDAADKRYGITLIARPPQPVKDRIQLFLSELKSIEPEQYYYPSSDIHITVMSVISCHTGFDLAHIRAEDYVHLIQASLQGAGKFQVNYAGITASPSCIIIQGFPQDRTLHSIRENVRANFKNTDLRQSIDERYAIQTAHSTVVRFRKPVQHQADFLATLKVYRETHFGAFTVDQLELVFNDWYQRKEVVKTLATFPL